jgi:hypothetical protein
MANIGKDHNVPVEFVAGLWRGKVLSEATAEAV